MRVADDGCGIFRDDIKVAFLRHATSKVKVESDLDSISTLGFRGEALASICAVSRLQLITRNVNEEIGTSYEIDGGEEQSLFWGPYRAEFRNVPAGWHTLRVRVGNLLINQLRSAAESGRGRWHRWAPSEEDYRSGLFGPVILEYEKGEKA